MKKKTAMLRGLSATAAAVFTLSTAGYAIAKSDLAVGWLDGWTGVVREVWEDRVVELPAPDDNGEGAKIVQSPYEKKYKSAEDYYDALRKHAIRQGEEGFAVLKNDNAALPVKNGGDVALFGWNCYNIPTSHTGITDGGSADDRITLEQGLKAAGVKVNDTIKKEHFSKIEEREVSSWGGTRLEKVDVYGMTKASANYTIPEQFDPQNSWSIGAGTTAIVAVGRGGGEGNNFMVDSATNAEDPLALSPEELEMIDYAKAHCSKVVVLVVSANAMELGPIAKGGAHEVDAIGFCGMPNAHQYQGIANVIAGKVNATGGLTDTYLYDNSYNPASINMGQQQYSDADLVKVGATPDELGRTNIANLNHANYIVELEGVYVGYKYYESRYYDSIVNPSSNATDTIGSTKKGAAWNYSNEVVYTFGHGLSYIPYSQEVKEVKVTRAENGVVEATIEVKNLGNEAGTFLTQLYVNRPYTQYDKDNLVEKSAIDFLNSKKVELKAGESKEVTITVPTKYLASWDVTALNGAGTYVLDDGDYYFTAANGAHEAVNNVLAHQGYTTDGTTEGTGSAKLWKLGAFDDKTFSTSNGYDVRNQAQDGVDINYWLKDSDKVTYLSRTDWKATFPKNYTNIANNSGIAPEAPFSIASSPKSEEWIKALRNIQYVPTTNGNVTNVEGILPAKVADGTFASVWDYIMDMAVKNPKAFVDINSAEWQEVAQAISLNVGIGNILNGGGATDSWYGIGNPSSTQSESVAGYAQKLTVDGVKKDLSVTSNTLLAASFNPDLAYEWGLLEGEGGLWLMDQGVAGGNAITVWGSGLNLHRHAYNGRNSEYMSEDPMLTNRIGEAQYRGAMQMGSINGPKHMGFNDQELNRRGNATYMTEQKMRETDIRCYEGALSDAHASGVMMSYARLGAINATNHVGLVKHIMREEWGFTGIITTDMGSKNYHEPYSLIMATVNQYAGFGSNDSYIGQNATDFSDTAAHKSYKYVTIGAVKKDPVLAEQIRQTSLYELYTIAHSASGGLYVRYTDEPVTGPTTVTQRVLVDTIEIAPWEYGFIATSVVAGLLTVAACAAYVLSVIKKED